MAKRKLIPPRVIMFAVNCCIVIVCFLFQQISAIKWIFYCVNKNKNYLFQNQHWVSLVIKIRVPPNKVPKIISSVWKCVTDSELCVFSFFLKRQYQQVNCNYDKCDITPGNRCLRNDHKDESDRHALGTTDKVTRTTKRFEWTNAALFRLSTKLFSPIP